MSAWRAEQYILDADTIYGWEVINDKDEPVCIGLDEPTARLIAAAPDMRDVLKDWYRICTNPHISSETYWNGWEKRKARIKTALEKAGS